MQQPKQIVFWPDDTATVLDQEGETVRGSAGGKEFAEGPPATPYDGRPPDEAARLATHAEVVAELARSGVDWTTLAWIGNPRLPADELWRIPDRSQRALALLAREAALED